MKRIALFGTSADPPTSGHQAILNWLSQHYDLVAVWASDNPFKSHQTPLEHRSRMLRLLIEELNSLGTMSACFRNSAVRELWRQCRRRGQFGECR
jgi:cytidyltransferase-like protein